MGVELVSLETRKLFMCNWHSWRMLFEMAKKFGWIPEGTKYKKDEDYEYISIHNGKIADSKKEEFIADLIKREQTWDGTYFSNDFQIVTEEDAANMRKALIAAIDAVDFWDFAKSASLDDWTNRAFIMNFILFLEKGAFEIW